MAGACERCGSERVGIYFFSRHGALSGLGMTLLLGLRRCRECGAEFSIRSGLDAAVYARRVRLTTLTMLGVALAVGVVYAMTR
jgi:hypothetical protein